MQSLLSVNDRVLAVGNLLGLLAGWSVILEILLMCRVPFIEYSFDLQEISDLHRLNGYVLLGTISGHFAFTLVGYASPVHAPLWSQFLAFNGSQYDDVLWATIGTVIFFVAGGLSVRAVRSRMRYELWYLIHVTIYFGIFLTFLHQIKLGSDFIASFWFAAYWYALYILTFGLWGWYRVLRPAWLFSKYRFKVQAVEKTASNVYSVVLEGRNLRDFAYEPGQYATWRVLTPELWYEAHPFSISSSPGMDTLRFTFKASPDFTERMQRLRKGSWVIVDGPRGNFTANRAADTQNVVLVAGGIGITPYLSNIEQLLRDGKRVTLLYAVRSPGDVAFTNELRQFEARGLTIRLYIDSKGQRITDATLRDVVNDGTTVFVCGPDAMSKALVGSLSNLGLPAKNIVTERFAF